MHRVTVNGKQRAIEEGTTMSELIDSLGLHEQAVAVEFNRRILKRSEFSGRLLADGDRIEIVRFVQGG